MKRSRNQEKYIAKHTKKPIPVFGKTCSSFIHAIGARKKSQNMEARMTKMVSLPLGVDDISLDS